MEKSKKFLEQKEKYDDIERMEHEIESLKRSIDIVGNGKSYCSDIQLDKDDYVALIELRKTKINKLEKEISDYE